MHVHVSKITAILFLAALTIALQPAVFSQVSTGTITGAVRDPNGAALPGATVTITQVSQNRKQTLTTNLYGLYEVQFLPIGPYVVTAGYIGFQAMEKHGLDLNVGQVMRVDFDLPIGSTTQTVEVNADASQQLNTETSEVGDIINQKQVADLPLNGRDFTDLIPLTAGAGQGMSGQSNGGFNFNGSRSDQNMYVINGQDNIDNNNNLLLDPPLESIQEIQVLTSTFSAEYGRTAGGIVTVQMKTGTNHLHGSLFEFIRNEIFDANGYFNNQVLPLTGGNKAVRSPLKQNQFGGSLGGPILKNKAFYFVDYQGTRKTAGVSTIQSVPTALEKQGDFTEVLSPGQILYQNGLLGTPYPGCNPAAFTPASCQVMPASGVDGIDPVAAKVIALYPLPNRSGGFITGEGPINNFDTSGTNVANNNQFDVIFSAQLTHNNTLAASYSFTQYSSIIPVAFDNGLVGPCIGCNIIDDFLGGKPADRIQNAGISEVHTFSSNTANAFHAGLSRVYNSYEGSDGGQDLATQIGMPNVNVSKNTSGLPWFFTTPAPTWIGTSPFTPEFNGYLTYSVGDNLNHQAGKHFLKAGFDLTRRLNNNIGNFFGKGEYVFAPLFTGNALGDFLSGRAYEIAQDLTLGSIGLREIEYAAYIQDDYKIRPRLTLNLGLRYDLFPGGVEAHNRLSSLNPVTGVVTLAGLHGAPRSLTNTNYKDFGPRVGFAYILTPKGDLVLRGGFGISYSNETDPDTKAGLNPPYTESFTLINLGPTYEAQYYVKDGLPVQLRPTVANFNPNSPAGSYYQVARTSPNPYTEYYTLGIEQELPGSILFGIGYVGAKGVHLPGTNQGDPAPPGSPLTQTQRRKYYNTVPNVTSITLYENVFSSSYNSLQVKALKRLSRGVQFMANYTWAQSIDDDSGSDVTGGGSNNPSAMPQDPFDIHADRAESSFNRRHTFVAAFNYDLPIGRGHELGAGWSRMTDAILGGWQTNGILTIKSGLPITVFASSSASCGCDSGSLRANLIGNPTLPKNKKGPNAWFNSAAFADPVLAYGDSPRNFITGPGYSNLDFSLFKKFRIRGTDQLVFRAEYFNILNRTNFINPIPANADWGAGGALTENYPARIGQFAIHYAF